MALIETDLKKLTPPLQQPTSDQERLDATIALIKARFSHAFAGLRSVYLSTKQLVENNPYKMTQEQVVAALGAEDWAQMQALGALLKTLLNTAVVGAIPDAPGGTPAMQATFPAANG